jgi:serine/threonine protein kinase/WD40 repeat protein
MSPKRPNSGTWSPDTWTGEQDDTEPGGDSGPARELPDRYTFLGMLGKGGMGEVWRVQDARLGRRVAMKVVGSALCNNLNAIARFREEALATAQLEHPGIVPVYDVGELEDGRVYYTMKEVSGRTLSEASAQDPGPDPALLQAVVDVCAAVGYAHTRRVLHRDLKPDNILLGEFGEVLVLDWGLVKLLEGAPEDTDTDAPAFETTGGSRTSGLTMAGQVAGTRGFMSPEQREGRIDDLTPASDVYALGAILYGLLHGAAPGERPAPPAGPPGLVELAMQALSDDPDDRPPDATAFGSRLREWLGGAREQARLRAAEAAVDADGRELLLRLLGPQGEAAVCARETLLKLGLDDTLTALESAGVLSGTAQVQLADPALLDWPLLKAWRAADGRVRPLLRDAAVDWLQENRPTHLLWAGPSLTEALSWRERVGPRLTEPEQEFLHRSDEQATSARRRRRLAGLAALATLVGVLVVLSVLLRQAQVAKAEEKAARLIAQVRLVLAEAGTHRAEGRPYAEVALFRAALNLDPDNGSAQAGLATFMARGDELQVRPVHAGGVRALAVTADGTMLSGGEDSTFSIIGPDGVARAHLERHGGIIDKLAVSPDGRLALSSSRDPVARLWDVRTGTQRHAWSVDANRIMDTAFNSDGSLAAIVNQSHLVQLRSTRTGEALWTARGGMELAFSQDDTHILAAGWGGPLVRMDAKTGAHVGNFDLGESPTDLLVVGDRVYVSTYKGIAALDDKLEGLLWRTESASVSGLRSAGEGLLAARVGAEARIVDAQTGETVVALETGEPDATAIAVLDDHIAVGDTAGRVHLWERGSWRKVGTYSGHYGGVLSLAWAQGAVFVGTTQGTVWELRPSSLEDPVLRCGGEPASPMLGTPSGVVGLRGAHSCVRIPDGTTRELDGELLGVSPGGRLALTWQPDTAEAVLFDLPGATERNRWAHELRGEFAEGGLGDDQVWFGDGRYSGSILDIDNLRHGSLDGPLDQVIDTSRGEWWSVYSGVAIGTDYKGTLLRRGGTPVHEITPPDEGLSLANAELTPTGHRIGVLWRPGTIILYDEALRALTRWQVPDDVRKLAPHPNGTTLAIASDKGSVQLLEVGKERPTPFAELGERINALAYSGTGAMLALSMKHHVRIYATEDGHLIREIAVLGQVPGTLSFAGEDKLVIGMRPTPSQWMVRTRARVPTLPRLSVCRDTLAVVVGEGVWADCDAAQEP